MKIDIVIPLYNEEASIRKSVAALVAFLDGKKFPYPYVITLADNGSTDASGDICRELADADNRVRHLEVGAKGKGLAIRTAWEKSGADIVSFMDMDLASDLSFLPTLIRAVAVDGYDMSIGNRLGTTSQVISKKRTRKVASWFYNAFTRMLFGSKIDDHQCGFKAMKKSSFNMIAPKLQEKGFTFDTELIAISIRAGQKIKEVDIIWRDGDTSKVSLFGDSVKMFSDLIRIKTRLGR